MNLVKYITPVNLIEEKVRFFNSTNYQPQFHYAWSHPDVIEWKKSQIKYRALLEAIDEQDGNQIVLEASKLFDVALDSETLVLAKNVVANKPDVLPPQSIEQLYQAFRRALEEL